MDPLSQLKDIHLPEPVSQYPVAHGWWLLLAMLIIILAVIVHKWLKARRFNMAKKQALIQLNLIQPNQNQQNNTQLSQTEILSLLKWCCLQYFPRQQVAKLHGQAFAEFLTLILPAKLQHADHLAVLSQALRNQYQALNSEHSASQETQALANAASSWIKTAITAKNIQAFNTGIRQPVQGEANTVEVHS